MTKWFRNILKGMSLTSILFVFQACYGTPADYRSEETMVDVFVTSPDGHPISNIKVTLQPTNTENIRFEPSVGYTDSQGCYLFYTHEEQQAAITAEDVDGSENGNYSSKDSVCVINMQKYVEFHIILDNAE